MNDKAPVASGSRWTMPIALLALAAYFVVGMVSGGMERGWWD